MKRKSLKLADIIAIASHGYPDGLIALNFNPKTGHATTSLHGDGLANFIVRELCETFDAEAPRRDQINEAVRVISTAARELESVLCAFHMTQNTKAGG